MNVPLTENYPLFVALTRTPMLMGVSQTFLVLSFIPCFLFLLITKAVVTSVVCFFVLYVAGVIGCLKDERFFDLLLGNLQLGCPNRHYWGCNSYDSQ